MKKFSLGILCLLSVLPGSLIAQNAWTQQSDQARTGWFPNETILNTTTVNQNTFGINFSHQTDDKVFSQPLVVLNVNIPNKGYKNVVFVTTVNNSVYAFDADVNADAYWQQNYSNKTPAPSGPDCPVCRPIIESELHPDLCGGVLGDASLKLGIIGTPVIDTLAGTMYFVTKVVNPEEPGYDNHDWNDPNPIYPVKYKEYGYTSNGFHQYLHAIDITTGLDRPNSPVEISPTVTGTGDGQISPGIISFNPRTQINRAGLILSNGKVYITFASNCDNNPTHGWIVSYDAGSLALVHAYVATPNDGRGGIWMSGTAPAVDESGNIYVTTGNSLNEIPTSNDDQNRIHLYTNTLASDPANRGESVVKLTPDLTLSSYFTPFNYIALNDADEDFGNQVMLIPNTNLSVTGCKDGNIYVMDRANLGGYDPYQNFVTQVIPLPAGATQHSSYAYFGGPVPLVYQYSENSQLTSYQISGNGLTVDKINAAMPGPSGFTGAFLSVSSNGSDPSTGILWAYQPQNACMGSCHGILHALNASDITQELWNSDMVTNDQLNLFNKFASPSIVKGKVFIVANKNQLICYGIKTNSSCGNNIAIGKPVSATSGGGSEVNVTDGDLSTRWTAANQDIGYITIDLGNGTPARFDICRIAINWVSMNYAKDYDLKISDDAINWTIIKSVRGNTSAYTEMNNGVTGRYIRMVGITRNGANPYAINEIQVFGAPASDCRLPGELTANTLSPDTEHISWDSVSGATRYIVKYRHFLSQEWLSKTADTNYIDLSALSCGSLYYYSVQANCNGVSSEVSQGSFTPTGCLLNSCDIFPGGYHNLDLGDIGVAGSTCKNGNLYTLKGSGIDIGGTFDQFQFAYTSSDQMDHEAFGLLVQQDQVYASNKLGIMIRDSLTSTSRFAFMASVDNGANFIFEYRDIPGGPVTPGIFPAPYPLPWMKLTKTGTNYTGYISPDKVNWTQIGTSVDLHFGNDPVNVPLYGMAVTSANNSALSTGKIQDFTFDTGNSNPLPVRLLNFSAKSVNHNHVLVSWATSLEHLTDYFVIQRSIDNKSFASIAQVNAVGESESEQDYSIQDNKPVPGYDYYRLKEVDKDGNFYFSPIVAVKFDAPNGFEIYPNPAGDFTNISSLRDPMTDVKLFDITGKLIQDIHLDGNQIAVQLNLSLLTKGIFLVSVKTTTGIYRQKLYKQ